MENRIRNLEKLCRLCGSKIILKLGYITAKRCSDYSDVLQQYEICNGESHEVKYINICIKRYRSKYLQIWLATVAKKHPIKLKSYVSIKFTHVNVPDITGTLLMMKQC